jgi:hypothetical protein
VTRITKITTVIGMVEVAAIAANAALTEPYVTITATRRRTRASNHERVGTGSPRHIVLGGTLRMGSCVRRPRRGKIA